MMKIFKIVGIVIFVAVAMSCGRIGKPRDFDYGKVENGVYTNTFFKLKMNIPQDWVVPSNEQMTRLQDLGTELIAGDDKNRKAVLKASEINAAHLLAAFQYEVGAVVDFNPSIMLEAENTKMFPGIKNGGDYLGHVKKSLQSSQLQYTFADEKSVQDTIGGLGFYKMEAQLLYAGLDIKQTYYSTLIDGFCLGIIISYINDEQKEVLMQSIASLSIDK